VKRSRFTKEQIIGVLREQEAGMANHPGLLQTREEFDFLCLEGRVKRGAAHWGMIDLRRNSARSGVDASLRGADARARRRAAPI